MWRDVGLVGMRGCVCWCWAGFWVCLWRGLEGSGGGLGVRR
jgi:hypothetical protein